MSSTADITFKLVFSLMITINFLGNALVIFVVLRNRRMQTPMNYLLTNLALADLLFALFFIPRRLLITEFRHPTGWVGDFLCKTFTHANLSWMASVAAVITLLFIAWERYHAIIHPHNSRGRMTKGRLRKLVIITWISSGFFLLPETWVIRYDEKKRACIFDFPDWLGKADAVMWLFAIGLFPLGAMGILYGRVVRRLWFTNDHTTSVSQRTMLKSRKRVTKTVLVITVVLGISWLPNLIYYFLEMFLLINDTRTIATNIGSSETLFRVVSYVFISINSTINPVIYATQDRTFRRHMWSVLTRCCGTRNNKVFGDLKESGVCVTVSGAGIALKGVGIECKLETDTQGGNHLEYCTET
ncbi:QRFP-like peptide receptor [Oculina patagonica]